MIYRTVLCQCTLVTAETTSATEKSFLHTLSHVCEWLQKLCTIFPVIVIFENILQRVKGVRLSALPPLRISHCT